MKNRLGITDHSAMSRAVLFILAFTIWAGGCRTSSIPAGAERPSDHECWPVAKASRAICVLQIEGRDRKYHGTGVAVSVNGHILTAFHNLGPAISEKAGGRSHIYQQAKTLNLCDNGILRSVCLAYQEQVFQEVRLVAASVADDLALLQIRASTPDFLESIPWHETSSLKWICGLGLGSSQLQHDGEKTIVSLAPHFGKIWGIPVSYEKGLPQEEALLLSEDYGGHAFLSSVSVKEGDSGGPCFDQQGRLVGICQVTFGEQSVLRSILSPVCREVLEALQENPGLHWALQIRPAEGRRVSFYPVTR